MFSYSCRHNMHTARSTRLHSISDTLTGDPFAQTRARRAHGSDMRAKFTVRQSESSGAFLPSVPRKPGVKRYVPRFCAPLPSPLQTFASAFSNFVKFRDTLYSFEQRDLSAVPITGIGFIRISSKGVSRGGSAARASGSKNGNNSERRACVSDRCVRWIDHR